MQHVIATDLPRAAGASPRPSTAARWIVSLFFYATLLAPAAPINKVVFLALVAWLAFDMIFAKRPLRLPTLVPFSILAIFAYGLLVSLVTWSEQAIALQYFTSALVLFVFYFVYWHRIQLDALVESASMLLIAATAVFWASIFWPEMPFGSAIYDFFDTYNFSSAVDREFFEGGMTFTLQLGTTPFLFVGLCVVWLRYWSPARRKTDFLFALLILAAIAASGLRGLVVVSSAFLVIVVFQRARWPARLILIALLSAAAFAAYLALADSLLFSAEEVSNATKLGHFKSFIDDMTIGSFLFGRGLGSYYFSMGSSAYRSYTELSPVDMMRYVGVPLTAIMYIRIMVPSNRLTAYAGDGLMHLVAMGLYVVLSLTNPVMLNSYGMLIVVWYWSKLHWRREAVR